MEELTGGIAIVMANYIERKLNSGGEDHCEDLVVELIDQHLNDAITMVINTLSTDGFKYFTLKTLLTPDNVRANIKGFNLLVDEVAVEMYKGFAKNKSFLDILDDTPTDTLPN